MPDCFAVVEEIQHLLAAGHAADTARVARAAADYNTLAQDAARRLYECCDCINRGHISQAIHLADAHPDLRDTIAALNFVGVARLRTLAAQAGAPLSPAFDACRIQQLDAAYTHQDALEPLQKSLRLMALKGAPAKDKLDVLRRIRLVDPTNENVARDIRALDAVRIREIGERVAAHDAAWSEAEAAELLNELTRGDGLCKPSDALVASVRDVYQTQRSARVQTAMIALFNRLSAAWSQRKAADVGACLNDLDRLRRDEDVDFPTDHAQPVREARAWLAQQEAAAERMRERSEGLLQIESLMKDDAPPDELAQRVEQFESDFDDAQNDIVLKAHLYVQQRTLAEHHARQGKLALATLGLILFIGFAAWSYSSYREKREQSAAIRDIQSATESMNFAEGARIIKQLKIEAPGVIVDRKVQEVIAQFDAVQRADTLRADQFKSLLTRCAGQDPLAPEMDSLLAKAAQQARTPMENNALAELKTTVELQRAARARIADDEVASALKQADALFPTLAAMNDLGALNAALAELHAIVQKAEAVQGLSNDTAVKVKSHRARLDREQSREAKLVVESSERTALSAKARAELQQIRVRTSDNLQRYSDELARRRTEFASVSPEFREAEKWIPILQAYIATAEWNAQAEAFLARHAGERLETSPRAFEDFCDVLTVHPALIDAQSPYRATLQKYAARAQFLATGAERVSSLRTLLKHDLLAKLHEFNLTVGDSTSVYYTHDAAELKPVGNGNVEVDVFLDETLTPEKKTIAATSVGKISTSPHVLLARDVSKLIENEMNAPVWASTFPKALQIVNDAKRADPYVRAVLLKQLVAIEAKCVNEMHLPPQLVKKINDLSAEKVSFWKTQDLSVRKNLDVIAKGLADVQSSLRQALAASDGARDALEVRALFRPLFMTATVEKSADGALSISPLPGVVGPKEFWIIETQNDGSVVFKIAAVMGAGAVPRWIDGVTVFASQPLLSPKDALPTRDFVRKTGAVSSPFPINLDSVGK